MPAVHHGRASPGPSFRAALSHVDAIMRESKLNGADYAGWCPQGRACSAILFKRRPGMGKVNPRNANGNARRKLRARLRAEGRPCHICGMPIDYALPAGDPWSFEVDELIPVSRGGDPLDYSNVDAAHRICNQRRGNRVDGDDGAKGLPIVRSRLF